MNEKHTNWDFMSICWVASLSTLKVYYYKIESIYKMY